MRTIRMSRLLGALLGVLLVGLLAVAPGPGSAQRPPIKIGFITDLTGTAAQAARDMVNGLTLYLDEIGNQMAGRKVELIVEDSQARPDVAITKLRKVVEHDRVHIVAGVLFGHLGYAMAPKTAGQMRVASSELTPIADSRPVVLKCRRVRRGDRELVARPRGLTSSVTRRRPQH